MAQLLRTARRMTTVLQARLYRARERRLSHVDPAFLLSQTHLSVGEEIPDTGTVFPDRTRPITFRFGLRRSSLSDGVIFSFGSSRQLVVTLDDSNLIVSVGDGSLRLGSSLPVADRLYRFVLAISPGESRAVLWRDGELADRHAEPFGSEWADDGEGEIGLGLVGGI